MGYAGDFLAPTLTAVADLQQDLTALAHLFNNDSVSLVQTAQGIHGTAFQGDSAQALWQFATTYQHLVQQNLAPISVVAKACATFCDGLRGASSAFDTAMPPGTNDIVDTIFTNHLLTPTDVLCSYNAYSYYYNADPITPAANEAYKAVILKANQNHVPHGEMFAFADERDTAVSFLQTWCSAVAQAHIDWTNAIANNGTGDIPPIQMIKGIDVNQGMLQMFENDFNTIGSPYGIASFKLSDKDQQDAETLYNLYKDSDPGLSLGLVEGFMTAGFSADLISTLLEWWNNIDWGKFAIQVYLVAKLLNNVDHVIENKDITVVNPPQQQYAQPQQSTKPPTSDGGGNPGDDEVLFRTPLRDGGDLVYFKSGRFQVYEKGDSLPPGAEEAKPPPLGQKWIDYTKGGPLENTGGSGSGANDDSGDPLGPDDVPDVPDFPIDPVI